MNVKLSKQKKNGIEYFIADKLHGFSCAKHFFSTRIGGVSSLEYSSLNLGIYTKDDKANLRDNFNLTFNALGMDLEKLTYLQQTHSNNYFVVNNNNYKSIRGLEADALITAEKGIPIGVFTADCVPVLVADNKNKIVAAIHAGWKGTVLRITQVVIAHMIEEMGSEVSNISCAIGPSIGPCCFEVGQEVADKFNYKTTRGDKLYVDLWRENMEQLREMGIENKNISCANLCTFCMEDTFYSYRRDNGKTGRLGAFIEII